MVYKEMVYKEMVYKEMVYKEEISELTGKIGDRKDLEVVKRALARKYKMNRIPKNSEIIRYVSGSRSSASLEMLSKKPTRSLSGIVVIAVMSSPHPCPHGKCAYCPGGVEKNSAQSYTGYEPASLRAKQNNYDPYEQVRHRVRQLDDNGHSTEKCELIVMGGTFTARDEEYQKLFIKRCLDALNDEDSADLNLAMQKNELAKRRCTGLTVETRPDWFKAEQIERVMGYGATRVELGVQTLDDRALKKLDRGHLVRDSIEAIRLSKKYGLKVCYHMMLGLPYTDLDSDLENFHRIFEEEQFMPDMLKIYPTLVINGTKIYDWWKAGTYTPPAEEDLIRLIAEIKSITPKWVRIQRIGRDIPTNRIDAGVEHSNIRELAKLELKARGGDCNCIRCREIGRADHRGIDPGVGVNVNYDEMRYRASGGEECFLSFDIGDALIGYLRLRLDDRAIIRELKVFGRALEIREKADEPSEWQHRGYGKRLVEKAEDIAKNRGYREVLVTSAIGTREYYKKLGYLRYSYWMKKEFHQ